MPPYVMKGDQGAIFSYFEAVSEAAELPVFIQNGPPPLGSSLSPKFMLRGQQCEVVCLISTQTGPGSADTADRGQTAPGASPLGASATTSSG